jgi:hypothetical protein
MHKKKDKEEKMHPMLHGHLEGMAHHMKKVKSKKMKPHSKMAKHHPSHTMKKHHMSRGK